MPALTPHRAQRLSFSRQVFTSSANETFNSVIKNIATTRLGRRFFDGSVFLYALCGYAPGFRDVGVVATSVARSLTTTSISHFLNARNAKQTVAVRQPVVPLIDRLRGIPGRIVPLISRATVSLAARTVTFSPPPQPQAGGAAVAVAAATGAVRPLPEPQWLIDLDGARKLEAHVLVDASGLFNLQPLGDVGGWRAAITRAVLVEEEMLDSHNALVGLLDSAAERDAAATRYTAEDVETYMQTAYPRLEDVVASDDAPPDAVAAATRTVIRASLAMLMLMKRLSEFKPASAGRDYVDRVLSSKTLSALGSHRVVVLRELHSMLESDAAADAGEFDNIDDDGDVLETGGGLPAAPFGRPEVDDGGGHDDADVAAAGGGGDAAPADELDDNDAAAGGDGALAGGGGAAAAGAGAAADDVHAATDGAVAGARGPHQCTDVSAELDACILDEALAAYQALEASAGESVHVSVSAAGILQQMLRRRGTGAAGGAVAFALVGAIGRAAAAGSTVVSLAADTCSTCSRRRCFHVLGARVAWLQAGHARVWAADDDEHLLVSAPGMLYARTNAARKGGGRLGRAATRHARRRRLCLDAAGCEEATAAAVQDVLRCRCRRSARLGARGGARRRRTGGGAGFSGGGRGTVGRRPPRAPGSK